MPVNLALYQNFIDTVESSIPQGIDLDTFLKTCFFIYDQDPVTGLIKIDDQSELLSTYNPLTDVHEVYVIIRKDDCNDNCPICYEGPFTPFGNLTYKLPCPGKYTVEIDVRYTVQVDDGIGGFYPHVFQTILMYPIEWIRSGDYHNTLLNDIKCRIVNLQCEILKRIKVGRDWRDLQNRIYALNNYLYALCNICLSVEEFDKISCAVKKIKKVC
jgi:hypothetical protein